MSQRKSKPTPTKPNQQGQQAKTLDSALEETQQKADAFGEELEQSIEKGEENRKALDAQEKELLGQNSQPTSAGGESTKDELYGGKQPTKETQPTPAAANPNDAPLPGAPVNYDTHDWLGAVMIVGSGYPEIQIKQSDRPKQRQIKQYINELVTILHPKGFGRVDQGGMERASALVLGIYRTAFTAGPRKEDDQLGDNYLNCMNIIMMAMAHEEIGKAFNKRYIYCAENEGFPYETLTTLLLRTVTYGNGPKDWQKALRGKDLAPTVNIVTESCNADTRSLSGKLRQWLDTFAQ
jgi:hypothetical protein